MNHKTEKPLHRWLLLVIGVLLVVQFAGLGAWQVSRGLEKRATQVAYKDESGFASWQDNMAVRPNQRLSVTGSYDDQHQFLLANIIVDGRFGYYVITPLVIDDNVPVLLVNRGWIQKTGAEIDASKLDLASEKLTVRGRVGSLPNADKQRSRSTHPSLEEMSVTLGRKLQPFVLLMDHQEPHGFVRHWVATEFGPGKHFGYAVQWFAMGAVLSALLIWNFRKKRRVAR